MERGELTGFCVGPSQLPGAVLHAVQNTAGLVQPAIVFGQYRETENGETIAVWEIEFGPRWDSGIFVNPVGGSQKQFAWTLATSVGPLRFEAWNDSMGKHRHVKLWAYLWSQSHG